MFDSIYKPLSNNSKTGLMGACALHVVLYIVSSILTIVLFPDVSNIVMYIIYMILIAGFIGGIVVLLILGMDKYAKILSLVDYCLWASLGLYGIVFNIIRGGGPIGLLIFNVTLILVIISIGVLYLLWKKAGLSIGRDLIPIACAAVLVLTIVIFILDIVVGYEIRWYIAIMDLFVNLTAPLIALFSYFNFFYNEKK